MSAPQRHVPLTPLDELRGCLGALPEGEGATQARLTHLLQQLRQLALPELGGRLARGTTPIPYKRAMLALTARFDWPEWSPWLLQALQQEQDLGVFDEGCAALGRLETRSAWEALQRLAAQRADPDRQLILRRELSALETSQPLGFYLGRLLEGETNPRLAHQGARGLAALASPQDLPTLWAALDGADPLAFRLLLRALAELPSGEVPPLLLDLFTRTVTRLEDLKALESLTQRIQAGTRTAARGDLVAALAERLEARAPEELAALRQAIEAGEAGQPGLPLDRLRSLTTGPFETFVLEALSVLLEGKVARFSAMVTEAQDSSVRDQATQGRALGLICEALTRQVGLGQIPAAAVLPALKEAFRRLDRNEQLDFTTCRLLSPEDEAGLDAVLAVPDPKRRAACLDVLGAREDDALVPFFLRAMQDSIVEVGQRAMHHLGKLPSSFPLVMAQFQSGQLDQMRAALRIFTENGTAAAAEPLMAFLRTDVRDDLLLEAVQALGAIRHPASAAVLLDLLHDGKPARLQEALVAALASLGTPEAGLGLLEKSAQLKLPQVLIVALEGTLGAFPGFERPLPMESLEGLEHLIRRCCDEREGEGQRLRAILATLHLYCFDQDFYTRLKDTFSDFLFELRTRSDWDRDTNDRVAAVVKELGRRSASLSLIAAKEAQIRSLVQAVPPEGPRRTPALLAAREALQDPEFIMRAELGQELATFVLAELARKEQDWRDLARLCEIGGLTRQASLVEPLKEQFHRASGLGLRSAAKESLLALGLEESDIARRAPIKTILLLEPSAFFRKRLLAVLDGWEVREAGSRAEAAPMLAAQPVDLLISETSDGSGDLRPWLKLTCETRRCRQVLFSTAARDTPAGEPWIMGVLYKPYPPEQLLKALEP